MWNRSIRFINQVTEKVTVLFLVIMVVIVFYQVFSRTFFSISYSWIDELVKYLMIWVILLGAGLCFQYSQHISIDLLYNKVSGFSKKLFQLIIAALCIFFAILLITKGLDLSARTMVQNTVTLKIPMGYIFYVFPISGVLIILNVIDVTAKQMMEDKRVKEEV